MVKFFKDEKKTVDPPNEYYMVLRKALEATMSVCVASTSALVINQLTTKICPQRMAQYNENSFIALQEMGKLRSFLFKVSQYIETKKINFLDARAPIKYTMSECRTGNCEHQAFYLAALLRQQKIPAFIYDIEDIEHTVVITKDFLLDPWIGTIFSLTETDLCTFYNSSLNMNASWLNHLLSDKEFTYPERLDKKNLNHYFAHQTREKATSANCCILF
ncbi:hypothetical protein [Legionella sp. WA2022007384]